MASAAGKSRDIAFAELHENSTIHVYLREGKVGMLFNPADSSLTIDKTTSGFDAAQRRMQYRVNKGLCRGLINQTYITDLHKKQRLDVFLILTQKKIEVAFATLKIFEHSATMDMICSNSSNYYSPYLIHEGVIRYLKKHHPEINRLRLWAVRQRVIFFRHEGFKISQHEPEEDPVVAEFADRFVKNGPLPYKYDGEIPKGSEYHKLIQLLVERDMIHQRTNDLRKVIYDGEYLKGLPDDSNGYSMLMMLH